MAVLPTATDPNKIILNSSKGSSVVVGTKIHAYGNLIGHNIGGFQSHLYTHGNLYTFGNLYLGKHYAPRGTWRSSELRMYGSQNSNENNKHYVAVTYEALKKMCD